MVPQFYLVVMLFSANSFFTAPLPDLQAGHAEQFISVDPMITDGKDMDLANILSQDNFVLALPIYDAEFKDKVKSAVAKLGVGDEDLIHEISPEEADEYYDDHGLFNESDNEYYVNKYSEDGLDNTFTE